MQIPAIRICIWTTRNGTCWISSKQFKSQKYCCNEEYWLCWRRCSKKLFDRCKWEQNWLYRFEYCEKRMVRTSKIELKIQNRKYCQPLTVVAIRFYIVGFSDTTCDRNMYLSTEFGQKWYCFILFLLDQHLFFTLIISCFNL